jgi:hypothetical protein
MSTPVTGPHSMLTSPSLFQVTLNPHNLKMQLHCSRMLIFSNLRILRPPREYGMKSKPVKGQFQYYRVETVLVAVSLLFVSNYLYFC